MTDNIEQRPILHVSVTGDPGAGKTLVSSLIARALSEYGMDYTVVNNRAGDYHHRIEENPGVDDLTRPQPDIIVDDMDGLEMGDEPPFRFHHRADGKMMADQSTMQRIQQDHVVPETDTADDSTKTPSPGGPTTQDKE